MTPVPPPAPLDPLVAEAIELIPFDHMSAEVLPSMRQPFELPGRDGVERVDHIVAGEPPIPVRVHRPAGDDRMLPCLYAMHGGGYVIGSREMDGPLLDGLCLELGAVGVSVDYRLAPETSYPGPLEDCYRGLLWAYDHTDELGIDRDRIGVMGSSAGGGLAAALAMLARDRAQISLAFQLLDAPMLDDRQITPSSRREDLQVWSRQSNAFGWQCYLGDLYGRDDVPATAAPARATDLRGLPPAFVAVGALDGFHDEDVAYAERLRLADVPTELHVYPGGCHGFQLAADAAITQQYHRHVKDWLRHQITG